MNGLSQTDLPVFNLLSIGQRGVGKTVFLAGSYVELQGSRSKNSDRSLWLECQDSQGKENLEAVLDYIARTGEYPPPTMKITDFNFSLNAHSRQGDKKLCAFRWWDVPGESCNFRDPDFQKMVLNSHSCCVFINGYALVNNPEYLDKFEGAFKQVMAIASLVKEHGLDYGFALIFTQCDLLEPGPVSQLQIEENLQPLLGRLDAVNAKYQRFYSAIPITAHQQTFQLSATGGAAALVWLLGELNKTEPFQERRTLESGLKQSVSTAAERQRAPTAVNPNRHRYLPILIASSLGVLVMSLAQFFLPSAEQAQTPTEQISQYESILARDPNNIDALVNLAKLYIEQQQPDKAMPVLEKIVQQRPDSLEWQFILAQLYENKEEKQKAESVYDRILAQQDNNIEALVKKAVLRNEQGDIQTAKTLFAKAEKVAPTDALRDRVKAISQSVLQGGN
ncbi:MAG: tetratricopeptide repeat protein [Hydrococcus sp. Prado102]|jgi:tetratricopeptide (TPR) repeat protein|nr:tetratricopeptide repeat protein [Hydrococcus sp. Prado102]